MKIDIMTLFPDTVNAVLHESILGRAAQKGILDLRCVQIRDYTENKQNQVDDYPYGGGWGCVMMAQPLKSCLDAIVAAAPEKQRRRVIYMSPQGKPFTQETARRLQRVYDHLVLVCGHYEGVDERFIEACVDEEISIGDFVLTGGEIAAMAVADAVCRLVPGVLSDEACYTGESHWDGLLEYPQYTRPELWEGRAVPELLLQGDHQKVERWRRKQQMIRTRDKRPDMFEKLVLTDKDDQKLLEQVQKEQGRLQLTEPVTCRAATEADLPALLEILQGAKALLRRRGIDQWQDGYPNEEILRMDLARDELYIVCHGEELAGCFGLTTREEPGYAAITDGKWTADVPYAVLHRGAVAEKYRGTGLAEKMLALAEARAKTLGARALRTDTHKKNKAMLRLLREHGYRYRGNIRWPVEPGHDATGQAYEKLLKK